MRAGGCVVSYFPCWRRRRSFFLFFYSFFCVFFFPSSHNTKKKGAKDGEAKLWLFWMEDGGGRGGEK